MSFDSNDSYRLHLCASVMSDEANPCHTDSLGFVSQQWSFAPPYYLYYFDSATQLSVLDRGFCYGRAVVSKSLKFQLLGLFMTEAILYYDGSHRF